MQQFADDAITPRISTRQKKRKQKENDKSGLSMQLRKTGRSARTFTPSTRWCLATRLTYSSLFAEVTALRDPPGMRSTCANEVQESNRQGIKIRKPVRCEETTSARE